MNKIPNNANCFLVCKNAIHETDYFQNSTDAPNMTFIQPGKAAAICATCNNSCVSYSDKKIPWKITYSQNVMFDLFFFLNLSRNKFNQIQYLKLMSIVFRAPEETIMKAP